MWDAGIGGSAMVNAGITAVIKPSEKKMSGEHMNYLEDVAAIGGTIGAVNGIIGFVRRQHHDVYRVQSWHRSRETGTDQVEMSRRSSHTSHHDTSIPIGIVGGEMDGKKLTFDRDIEKLKNSAHQSREERANAMRLLQDGHAAQPGLLDQRRQHFNQIPTYFHFPDCRFCRRNLFTFVSSFPSITSIGGRKSNKRPWPFNSRIDELSFGK